MENAFGLFFVNPLRVDRPKELLHLIRSSRFRPRKRPAIELKAFNRGDGDRKSKEGQMRKRRSTHRNAENQDTSASDFSKETKKKGLDSPR